MVLQTAAMIPGSFHTDAEINQVPVAAADTYAAGDVVFLDPATDTFKAATTGMTLKRFGVAVEASAATAAVKKLRVAVSGHVVVKAQGAIAPSNRVKVGTTTGRVAEAVEATDAATTIVGTYVGKAEGNERDGTTIPAAADGDPIWIKLGLGGGGF